MWKPATDVGSFLSPLWGSFIPGGLPKEMTRFSAVKLFRYMIIIGMSFAFSACSLSLTADVTPPPGAETSVAVTTPMERVSSSVYPLVPPDSNNGKLIYEEKCASCHGHTGMGDGERANQLPNPVTVLNSPEIIRRSAPSNWFITIKNGNLKRYMPPFPSLSDRQIWDVVAYLYRMGSSDEDQVKGKQAYQAYCSRCHGEQAKGDGEDARKLTKPPTNLVDLAYISTKSSQDLYQSITTGKAPDMPSFGSLLSEEDRWAIIDYLRGQVYASPLITATTPTPVITQVTPSSESVPTISPTAIVETGIITGKVINGTDNDPTSELTVTLRGYDNMVQVITETTKTESDGHFLFRGVEFVEGRVFLTTTEFDNVTYSSDVNVVAPETRALDLPITVYKSITDTSIIKVDRLHLFFEMVDEQTVRIVELYIMSNPSKYTLVQEREGVPTIKFKLPVGSKNLQFQDSVLGDRYIETPDGFGDTYGVRPGSGNYQVVFAFEMPYNRKMELVQTMTLPVDAVVILVPKGTIRIRSEMLQEEGTRTVEDVEYQMYSGGSIAVGQDLKLTVTGNLGGSPTFILGENPNMVIGTTVFVFALVFSAFFLYWQKHKEKAKAGMGLYDHPLETKESLMDAILALDDLYQAGELPEEAYQQRRSYLKERLKAMMGRSEPIHNPRNYDRDR